MGRFILSRDASGVRFLLESDTGRTLAVSKQYATLDAAKKGICSLVYYAPIIPLIDTTVGESAPNPKFELLQAMFQDCLNILLVHKKLDYRYYLRFVLNYYYLSSA